MEVIDDFQTPVVYIKEELCDETHTNTSHLHDVKAILSSENEISEKIFRYKECDVNFRGKSHLNRYEKVPFHRDLHNVENTTSQTLQEELSYSTYKTEKNKVAKPINKLIEVMKGRDTINRPFTCVICGKDFGRNSHLKRHLKIHDNKTFSTTLEYDCSIHDSLEENVPEQTEPVCIISTSEETFDNADCVSKNKMEDSVGDSAGQNLSVNATVTHENAEGNYVGKGATNKELTCKICNKAFLRIGDLNRHSNLHVDIEYYDCEICSKRFKQATYLRAHVNSVHGTREKPEKIFDCPVCSRSFGRMSHVKRHMKLHIGGPTYDCDICGKKFLQNGNLKAHVRMVHSQERSFQCEVCSKMFLQRSNLNTHMRVHTGEKPHKCDKCGMREEENQVIGELLIRSIDCDSKELKGNNVISNIKDETDEVVKEEPKLD
ncbi:hypothetical protein SK128_004055 [Halocaridina rubra]|uniref:C2H2-type domain-containing protein n=1 Tax=Halocaridina rubra TaxID=373956 RepID=A0AAN8ZW58_HALRR